MLGLLPAVLVGSADAGYRAAAQVLLALVRADGGFVVLPKRWIVEQRFFAHLTRGRRLVREH
ncbi:hypothetical protein [Kitasatospora sp. NPDC002040]|uniref:hypothetical protein n=1 Tax=Kitasatospora sp. NPDC002040 TaxID=3154661 RepID=UPI0033297916